MNLNDIITLIGSEVYVDQFRGEYFYAKYNYDKLHTILVEYDAGKILPEDLTCPINMIMDQVESIRAHIYRMEVRACYEEISLDIN